MTTTIRVRALAVALALSLPVVLGGTAFAGDGAPSADQVAAWASDSPAPAHVVVAGGQGVVAGCRDGASCDECKVVTHCEEITETVKVPVYGIKSVPCTKQVEEPVYEMREVPIWHERRVPVFVKQEVPLVGKRTLPVYQERRTPIVKYTREPCMDCRSVPVYETRWVQDESLVPTTLYGTRVKRVEGYRPVDEVRAVAPPTFGTREVPIRKKQYEPVYEEVEVPVYVHRETTDVLCTTDECGCPGCDCQDTRSGKVQVGTKKEKRLVGWRETEGAVCGTRCETVKTGHSYEEKVVGQTSEWGTLRCEEETYPRTWVLQPEKRGWRQEQVQVGCKCESFEKGFQLGEACVTGYVTHKDAVGQRCEQVDAGTTVKSVFAGWKTERVYMGTETKRVQVGTRLRTVCDGTREVRVQIGEREERRVVGYRKVEDHVGPPEAPRCDAPACTSCAGGK
ncbi:MAG: hypothetical protein AB7T63_08735 [Planctomycetota bacterium]